MRKNGTCEGFKWQNFQALDILLMKKRHIWTERRMDPCRRPYLTWPKSFRQLLYFLKKWLFYFTGSAFLPLLFYQECWEIRKFIALILLVRFAGSFYFQNKPLVAASAFTTGNCPRQPVVACFFEWCKFSPKMF